jgi:MFS superfamily sulfate permease-like transporter
METIHVVAIVIVVGSIARLDLRLAGLVSRHRPVSELVHEMLPWTWTSFVIATIFGVLLFASQPLRYVGIAFFDVKMILILLAGINMLLFQYLTFASVGQWDRAPIPPAAVRIAGSLSLAFWISVVVCGRLIGFV